MKKNILLVAIIGFNLQAVSINPEPFECLKRYGEQNLVNIIRNLKAPCGSIVDQLKKSTLLGGNEDVDFTRLAIDIYDNNECFDALSKEFDNTKCSQNFIKF
jgi:hypothetical protein